MNDPYEPGPAKHGNIMPLASQPITAVPCDPDSTRGKLISVIQETMAPCKSVLELGAGHFEIIGALSCVSRVGVEIHKPYIDYRICDPYVIPIQADALTAISMFPDKSFDGIMLVDFIEHLEKETALNLLEKVENVARRISLIHCPIGHHPQESDVFGLGGDEYQRHRSEWTPNDFERRGYNVEILEDFFSDKPDVDPRALIAVKRI